MKESSLSRRRFLQTSLVAPVAYATGVRAEGGGSSSSASSSGPLPRRKLGKSGPEVTVLNLGAMVEPLSPEYLEIAWSMGVRYVDTADCYKKGNSERIVGEWLTKYPERRKDLFLVSKAHPKGGVGEMPALLDLRLAACKTDHLDLFFIHGIGAKEYGEGSLAWPKSDEFKKVCEQMKSSGKTKMVGFSCHDARLPDYLTAAAEGGFLDAIMLAYNPFYKEGDAFDLALTACHKAGIGLVAMKTMRPFSKAPQRTPEFDQLGLTTHQAVIQTVLSDPRISSVCSHMNNVDQLALNTDAGRLYKKPMDRSKLGLLKGVAMSSWRTMCPGCPSCRAAAASTGFAFHDIARFVSYYEQEGNLEARDYYQGLAESERSASGVDLQALKEACVYHTDYPEIVRRAERYFS